MSGVAIPINVVRVYTRPSNDSRYPYNFYCIFDAIGRYREDILHVPEKELFVIWGINGTLSVGDVKVHEDVLYIGDSKNKIIVAPSPRIIFDITDRELCRWKDQIQQTSFLRCALNKKVEIYIESKYGCNLLRLYDGISKLRSVKRNIAVYRKYDSTIRNILIATIAADDNVLSRVGHSSLFEKCIMSIVLDFLRPPVPQRFKLTGNLGGRK
jgi:hypothetical protein